MNEISSNISFLTRGECPECGGRMRSDGTRVRCVDEDACGYEHQATLSTETQSPRYRARRAVEGLDTYRVPTEKSACPDCGEQVVIDIEEYALSEGGRVEEATIIRLHCTADPGPPFESDAYQKYKNRHEFGTDEWMFLQEDLRKWFNTLL